MTVIPLLRGTWKVASVSRQEQNKKVEEVTTHTLQPKWHEKCPSEIPKNSIDSSDPSLPIVRCQSQLSSLLCHNTQKLIHTVICKSCQTLE